MNLQPFQLERYFARYEFNTEFLMCSSDCESLAVKDLLGLEPGAAEGLDALWLGYTESQGSPSLRREIARIYTTVDPEEVLVHAGAEEAIFLFMHAALEAGDHVVVHMPCYQSLGEVAAGIGARVSAWRGRAENGWAPDPDELKNLLRPNTRAVVINTPHNPTGYLFSREAFAQVCRLTAERGVALFCDEVYRELEHDPALRLPAAADANPLAVSLGVMSKTYGLAGLRIGWAAGHNRAVMSRMAALKDYTTICSSAPSEYLAGLALRHREQLARRNLEIIRRNLDVLDGLFARHPDRFAWQRPGAGSVAFPGLVGEDVESFCDRLVRGAGVLLAPGNLFGDDGNHFRVGFGRENLPQAVARMEEFLAR